MSGSTWAVPAAMIEWHDLDDQWIKVDKGKSGSLVLTYGLKHNDWSNEQRIEIPKEKIPELMKALKEGE